MIAQIKSRIDSELAGFIKKIDRTYRLSTLSPILYKNIKEFVLRKGKRIRPLLFIVGYLGFAKKAATNLYTSALSLELLHDFMLVHDDIIDKSKTRRGKPSMHEMLNSYLKNKRQAKFNGQDLSIVAADIIYPLAIQALLSVNEKQTRKEKALMKFIEATVFTGSGEFIELLSGLADLENISKQEILKIYDYKTAFYSFASPLAIGAILAGAKDDEVNKLFTYGVCLGRAFQIKDDILGLLGEEHKIGKPNLSDLQEAKKTLLIWYAYNNSARKEKALIKRIFAKKRVGRPDLFKIRGIIDSSGALEYTEKQITILIAKSEKILSSSSIKLRYKNSLTEYCRSILQ